jgi:hypothetical protein
MEGLDLESVSGSCEFSRMYKWDAYRQDWSVMSLSTRFNEDEIYGGFVAEVTTDCRLSPTAPTVIPGPPPLPT